MTPDVIAELNKEGEPSEFHKAILDHAKALVKTSRSAMSRHYSDWDMQDEVYRGLRHLDAEDADQIRKGKPTKMVIPHTFAQVQTFCSFLFLLFNQNRTFFELSPTGEEDYGTKHKDMEKVLEQNLRFNQWNRLLFQHLLDTSRFGIGINEVSWDRKLVYANVTPDPTIINFNGTENVIRAGSSYQEFIKYEGNRIRSVSPYRFLPDTRHPLVDFQNGEFCACEEEYSKGALRDMQNAGEVAGIDHIQPLPRDLDKVRGGATRSSVTSDVNVSRSMRGANQSEGTVLVTKCQIRMVPSRFKFGPNDKKLGPEEHTVLYHVWYANDNRVIRCEPAGWWHDQFSWSVGHFTPDMHQTINMGLADLIYRMQDVISWFVNSHISSVRRIMQNRLVVNPATIDTKTLDGEGDIYLRKGFGRVSPTDALFQLKVQDVTGGHMSDAEMISKMVEVVTGVNGNAMGQYATGRRSAQESRAVTAGAAGRMKMHGHLLWESAFAPLGQMMLANNRQSLSQQVFGRIIGGDPALTLERYNTFRGTPEDIICGNDYFMFDSTLSSEKGFIAQSLQELLSVVMANPIAAQQLDLDPRAMLDEIQTLRGAGPVSRFSLSKNIQNGAAPLPLLPVEAAPALV